MRVERFHDQYMQAAAAYGTTVEELRERDRNKASPPRRWLALAGNRAAGAVMVATRLDRRTFLSFVCPDPAAYTPLARAVAADVGGRLYTAADAADTEALAALRSAGFVEEYEFERFRVPFAAALAAVARTPLPSGFSVHAADDVDERRLFTLDVTVRQDVPGTEGWRGDRAMFHAELAEAPPFDHSAYLVAVDNENGEYAGLARIWRNASGPRFGLVGVARQYRSTLIGPALIRLALEGAAGWGHETFATEASTANPVTHRRMKRLGESLGRDYQLVRRG